MCTRVFFTVFLKNRIISSKIKRSKVTDYAALNTEVSDFSIYILSQYKQTEMGSGPIRHSILGPRVCLGRIVL